MRSILALVVFVVSLPAAPVPKGVKKPPSADGVWECVEMNSDGRSMDVPAHMRYFKIDGETMSNGQPALKEMVRPIGELRPFTLRIDDSARPTLRTMVDSDGIVHSAVFELDGDTLRWAFTTDRDRTLIECKPGLGVCYYLFHRVKEGK